MVNSAPYCQPYGQTGEERHFHLSKRDSKEVITGAGETVGSTVVTVPVAPVGPTTHLSTWPGKTPDQTLQIAKELGEYVTFVPDEGAIIAKQANKLSEDANKTLVVVLIIVNNAGVSIDPHGLPSGKLATKAVLVPHVPKVIGQLPSVQNVNKIVQKGERRLNVLPGRVLARLLVRRLLLRYRFTLRLTCSMWFASLRPALTKITH